MYVKINDKKVVCALSSWFLATVVSRALLLKADWIRRATVRQYELWRAPSPATDGFDIAPGLFRPTSTRATLHWSTSERFEVQVLCGSNLGDLTLCAETDGSGPTTVELTGLEPDADAWYRIRIRPPDGEWSEGVPQRFRTARLPGPRILGVDGASTCSRSSRSSRPARGFRVAACGD